MATPDQQNWDARYADPTSVPELPSTLITSLRGLLPGAGQALDVAGGAGRHAIWLTRQGLDTTIVDISPRGLALCHQRAAAEGVAITAICRDLQAEPLPAGPWDVILSCCYLQRSLIPAMIDNLARGGLLIISQPTRKNLERHAKPPAEFLLEEGELPRLVGDLEIATYREGWLEEGRHEAIIAARKA